MRSIEAKEKKLSSTVRKLEQSNDKLKRERASLRENEKAAEP